MDQVIQQKIIAVLLIVFFVVMIPAAIVSLIHHIYGIIYQRSGKITVNPFTYCEMNGLLFTLIRRRKVIDQCVLYAKHRGYTYFLGLKGIYKLRLFRFEELTEETMRPDEKELIAAMTEDCQQTLREDNDCLQHAIARYGMAPSDTD